MMDESKKYDNIHYSGMFFFLNWENKFTFSSLIYMLLFVFKNKLHIYFQFNKLQEKKFLFQKYIFLLHKKCRKIYRCI